MDFCGKLCYNFTKRKGNYGKNIKIILLEDNDTESMAFQEFIETKNNITLVAKTKSSIEALDLVKNIRQMQ